MTYISYIQTYIHRYIRTDIHTSMHACIHTNIYGQSPQKKPTFFRISPPNAVFRAVFVVVAKHPPTGPDFA